MEEIWKPVVGYEGLYEVSNLGQVRGIKKTMGRRRRILHPHITQWGYKDTVLTDAQGKTHHCGVHRLVALAFIDIPEHLRPFLGTRFCQVNHKDENKLNNHVDNLEWVSAKENTNYGSCIKRRAQKWYVSVSQYDLDGNLVASYESMEEASIATGIYKSQICCCCKGLYGYKTAGGYIWKYNNK